MLSEEKSLSEGAGHEKGLTWTWEQRRASQLVHMWLPQPPRRAIHRPQAPCQHCATKGYRSHCCPSAVSQAGVQVTAGVQVLPAMAQLCLLTASPPPKDHGIPQHPPHTSQCVLPHPHHTHDTPWHPTPITPSTTLHTPPASPHTPTSPLSHPPTTPSSFGVCNWGLPSNWARRQLAGCRLCCGEKLGRQNKGLGQAPRG